MAPTLLSLLVSFRVLQRDGHTGCLGDVHCCPSNIIQPSVTIGGTLRGCRKLVIMQKKSGWWQTVPSRCFLYWCLPISCPAAFLQSTAQRRKTCTWLSSPPFHYTPQVWKRPGRTSGWWAGDTFPTKFGLLYPPSCLQASKVKKLHDCQWGPPVSSCSRWDGVDGKKNLQKLQIGNGQIND